MCRRQYHEDSRPVQGMVEGVSARDTVRDEPPPTLKPRGGSLLFDQKYENRVRGRTAVIQESLRLWRRASNLAPVARCLLLALARH